MMNYIYVSLATLVVMGAVFYGAWYSDNVLDKEDEQFETEGYLIK